MAAGQEELLYFAHDDMEAHGVTERMLFDDLARQEASPETRALVADLLGRAREHLARGLGLLQGAESWLEKDCLFILELIITMYERVIDKIESSSFDSLAGRHRLSPEEKQQVIQEVGSGTNGLPHNGVSPGSGSSTCLVGRLCTERERGLDSATPS